MGWKDDPVVSTGGWENDPVVEAAAPKQSAPQQKTGPQPSFMQNLAASPIGRLANEMVVEPIGGIMSLINSADPTPIVPTDRPLPGVQKFQDAFAAQQNRPGYAQARASADARAAQRGAGGMMDQVLAPLMPAAAGVAGMFSGGPNGMMAEADAQKSAQVGFQERHPILSLGAGLTGGFAMGGPARSLSSAAPFIPMPKTPQTAALDYVSRLMKSSKTAPDAAGLRAAQAAANGKPITAAEAIGKPGEVALGALARREGETADALGGMGKSRSAQTSTRIMDDYAAASGIHPQAARGDIEGFIEANQKAASPLYDEAYKANSNIASPMLDRILETPAGKKALADARVKMQNDMSLMGTPDAELMDQAIEGGTDLPARGAASGMKLRVYDYVKRSLDDQIDSAYRAGNKNEGNIIKDLRYKMVSELDKADITAQAGPNSLKPEGGAYARARAKAGEYLSAKKQFELGQQQILDDKFPAKDFGAHLKKLGDADRQAYMGGAANRLFNLHQSGKLKADVFKSPGIRLKLSEAMGRDKADAFIRNMETEERMANFVRQRAPGAGSPTAEYQQAMVDQDGMSARAADMLQLGGDALTQGPMRAIGNMAIGKTKDAMASYMTRGMGVPVRDQAGKMLMLSPEELANLYAARPPQMPAPAFQLPMQAPPRGAIPLGLFGASGQFGRQ